MITSYSTLKDSIASFLHRSDLTSIIPELIVDAEARIYNDLRIRCMEASYSEAIASYTVQVPDDFLEWKFLYIDDSSAQQLTYKYAEWIYANYPIRNGSGKPVFYAFEGDTLIFGPSPNDTYIIKGRYYKRLPALSDSNTTNWFIENEPSILRYAALCEAAPYIQNDERIGLWEGKYQAVKERIKTTDRRASSSGSQLSMRAA